MIERLLPERGFFSLRILIFQSWLQVFYGFFLSKCLIHLNVLGILLQIRLALSPHLVWGSVIQGLKAFWLIKKSSGYFCRKNVSAFSNSHSALFATI